MGRVLFLGGTYSDIPLIETLKQQQHTVLLLNNEAVESVNCYGDGYICSDYSDNEAVLAAAKNHSVDYLVSGCNDAAYLSCAYVAEKLGLPGYDSYKTAITLHHKDHFREFMCANGLATHKYVALSKIEDLSTIDEEDLSFPLIVKPVDRSGGKGISTVADRTELECALLKAFDFSNSGNVVIEEFLPGELKSCSAFLVDGNIVFSYFDNEYLHYNPYQVSTSLAPLVFSPVAREKLIESVSSVADIMCLVDGLLHTQFLLHGEDIHIIEITRRTPGDLYAYPVTLLTGENYTSLTLAGYMGKTLHVDENKAGKGCVIRHCPSARSNGVIQQYVIDPTIKDNIVKSIKYLDVGDAVTNYEFQRMGVFILYLLDEELASSILSRIDEIIYVKVDS